jgi:preprotein translocase subunit SecD
MNRYPWWKYALLGVILVIGLLYTLPNLYGEAPAVQVSSGKVHRQGGRRHGGPRAAGPAGGQHQADFVQFDGKSVRARFADTDTQIKAKDAITKALNPDPADPRYIVALNLVSRSPQWLTRIRALPMFLGLDLRGGVHFLMEVDMRAALKQSVDTLGSDARNALREKRIRFAGITRDPNGLTISPARRGHRHHARPAGRPHARHGVDTEPATEGVRLIGRLTPKAINDIKAQALQQNIDTLHKRVNELGVSEPVIQQQGSDRVVVQLPGVQDTARAKDIIGRTATLQFRLVEPDGASAAETVPQRQARATPRCAPWASSAT